MHDVTTKSTAWRCKKTHSKFQIDQYILIWEYEKFIDMAWDSTLQLTFEKQVEFSVILKDNIHNYQKKILKQIPTILAAYVCEAEFSSLIQTKTIYFNRLNTKAVMRIQGISIKLDNRNKHAEN